MAIRCKHVKAHKNLKKIGVIGYVTIQFPIVNVKMNLYFTQSISFALGALVSHEQDRLQCAPKDTVAYSRFMQFDRQ